MLTHLQQEAADLRRKVSATKALEDQINHVQSIVQQAGNANRFAEEEGRARVDATLQFINTLRNEIEAQRKLLNDKRTQNSDLSVELARINDGIDTKKIENARLRVDLAAQRE